MGEINSTCAITQVPILFGEPVVAILLIPSRDHEALAAHLKPSGILPHAPNGYNHPNDIWSPVCTPLYGTYDGYGAIENLEGMTTWDNHCRFWKRDSGLTPNAYRELRGFLRAQGQMIGGSMPAIMLIHLSVWNTIQVHIRDTLFWSGSTIKQSVEWDMDYICKRSSRQNAPFPHDQAQLWYGRIAGLEGCTTNTEPGRREIKAQMYFFHAMRDMRKLYQPQSGQDQNGHVHLQREVMKAGIRICNAHVKALGIDVDYDDDII